LLPHEKSTWTDFGGINTHMGINTHIPPVATPLNIISTGRYLSTVAKVANSKFVIKVPFSTGARSCRPGLTASQSPPPLLYFVEYLYFNVIDLVKYTTLCTSFKCIHYCQFIRYFSTLWRCFSFPSLAFITSSTLHFPH